jgi:hypothetical protein
MFLNKVFDSEPACREWAKRCVSRGIQIALLVTHHAQIFEEVCVREHHMSCPLSYVREHYSS